MKTKFPEDKLLTFEIIVNDDDDTGIRLLSLVVDPAIEMKGMFFSKEDIQNMQFKAVPEKQMVVGPAVLANKKIFRTNDELGDHYVLFKPATIKTMVDKFNRNNNNRSINVDHTNRLVNGYIQQNWIVEDPIYDKSRFYGYNLPIGSWFVEVKIEDKEFWDMEVKELGKYSFSIEGLLGQKEYAFSKDFFIDYFKIIDELTADEVIDIVSSIE